jgi:hypothetical protein
MAAGSYGVKAIIDKILNKRPPKETPEKEERDDINFGDDLSLQ